MTVGIDEPFIIGSAETLAELATLVNSGATYSGRLFAAAEYKVAADIDLSGIANWTPIGTQGDPFKGDFDGGNYVISNMTITGSSDYVGLFGFVDDNGTIQNVRLEDVNVSGGGFVGGLAGYFVGKEISSSYATGSVTGSGNSVGGLVGQNNAGSISNSYAAGSVSGSQYVGGLIGDNYEGSISNCYAMGEVTGTINVGGLIGHNSNEKEISSSYATGRVKGQSSVGGLVGWNEEGAISHSHATGEVTGTGGYVGGLVGNSSGGAISNSYATGSVEGSGDNVGGLVGGNDIGAGIDMVGEIRISVALNPSVSGNNNVGKVAGYSSAYEMVDLCYSWAGMTVTGSGSGADGTALHYNAVTDRFDETWSDIFIVDLSAWENTAANQLPTLKDVGGNQSSQIPEYIIKSGADMVILSEKDLIDFRNAVNGGADFAGKTVLLGADITLRVNWTPIGVYSASASGGYYPFCGTFDGGNHVISNMTITGSNDCVGLFGYVDTDGADNSGVIKNVGLENVNINGGNEVGGLAGVFFGKEISNSYVTGSVTGRTTVGGLVGDSYGEISNCYVIGKVEGNRDEIGGLVGYNKGNISNSYATGSVTGSDKVGGLVGWGDVNNSISSSAALHSSVGGAGATDVGKVAGLDNGTIQNCFAANIMQLLGSSGNASENGTEEEVSKIVINNTLFPSPWILEQGFYPRLQGSTPV